MRPIYGGLARPLSPSTGQHIATARGRGAGGPRDDRASRFRAPPCNEPPLPSLQRGVGADALLPGPSRGGRRPEERALVLPAVRYHLPPRYGRLAVPRQNGG